MYQVPFQDIHTLLSASATKVSEGIEDKTIDFVLEQFKDTEKARDTKLLQQYSDEDEKVLEFSLGQLRPDQTVKITFTYLEPLVVEQDHFRFAFSDFRCFTGDFMIDFQLQVLS